MSLKYEPASEPLHISVKYLFTGIRAYVGDGAEDADRVGAEEVVRRVHVLA